MPYKRASELEPGDMIRFPDESKGWSMVLEVGEDYSPQNSGKIYVAIKGYGHVLWYPNKEVEVKG